MSDDKVNSFCEFVFQIIESRERQDVNKSMDDDGAVCVSHLVSVFLSWQINICEKCV